MTPPPSSPSTEAFSKPVPGSLLTILCSYKSIVSREIRKAMNQEMIVWQGQFHDHIIRNEASLNRIRAYVATNPARWRDDTFFAE